MREKRPDPLRGSGLFRGSLWLSRGERAALDALGDAGPYILRGGFVWGWRAIAVQAALVALMLLPWVYYVGNLQVALSYDFFRLYGLYALFGLPVLHVALMVFVDGMQATRVARMARQLNVHLTSIEPAAVALCAVLPQRRSLTCAVLLGTLADAGIVAADFAFRHDDPSGDDWLDIGISIGFVSLWRVIALLGLRGPVEHRFVRNWLSWGRGFWGSVRASAFAHLFLVPPVLFTLFALQDPCWLFPLLVFILGYPLLVSSMWRDRIRNGSIPAFDDWWMFREDAE